MARIEITEDDLPAATGPRFAAAPPAEPPVANGSPAPPAPDATRVFCHACGIPLDPAAAFCSGCGAAQVVDPFSPPPPVEDAPPVGARSGSNPAGAVGGPLGAAAPHIAAGGAWLRSALGGRAPAELIGPALTGAAVALGTAWVAFLLFSSILGSAKFGAALLGGSLGAPLVTSVSSDPFTGGVNLGDVSGSIQLPLTGFLLVPLIAAFLGGALAQRRFRPSGPAQAALVGVLIAPPFALGIVLLNLLFSSELHAAYFRSFLFGLFWASLAGALGGYCAYASLGRAASSLSAYLGRLRVRNPAWAVVAGTLYAATTSVTALFVAGAVISAGLLLYVGIELHLWVATVAVAAAIAILFYARLAVPRLPQPTARAHAWCCLAALVVCGIVVFASAPMRAAALSLIVLLPTLAISLLFLGQGIHYHLSGSYGLGGIGSVSGIGATSNSHDLASATLLSRPVGIAIALVTIIPILLGLVGGARFAATTLGARTRERAVAYGLLVAFGWTVLLLILRTPASMSLSGGFGATFASVTGEITLGPNLASTILCGLLVGGAGGAVGGALTRLGEEPGSFAVRLPAVIRIPALPVFAVMSLVRAVNAPPVTPPR